MSFDQLTLKTSSMKQQQQKTKPKCFSPKMELKGFLVPVHRVIDNHFYQYKLVTHNNEYFLQLNEVLLATAKKIEWDKVKIRGHLYLSSSADQNIFEVEKISMFDWNEKIHVSTGSLDWQFDLDQCKRSIARAGVLDVSPEYLVS